MTAEVAAAATGLARCLLDDESPLPTDLDSACALALARALKAQCYEAWNTAPIRAVQAAERQGALAAQAGTGPAGRAGPHGAGWPPDRDPGAGRLDRRLRPDHPGPADAVASFDPAAAGLRAAILANHLRPYQSLLGLALDAASACNSGAARPCLQRRLARIASISSMIRFIRATSDW